MSALDSIYWDTSKNVYYYNYDSKTLNKPDIATGAGLVIVRKYGGMSTVQLILTQVGFLYARFYNINLIEWGEWKKL